MNIQAVAFFVFLSALFAGNIHPVTARLNIYTGATGGNGTFTCHYPGHFNRIFLCKDDCKGENILVETDADLAANGRYSVQYRKEKGVKSASTLIITITDLKKSDSGRYSSGFGWANDLQFRCDVQVRVTDAPFHGKSRFAYTYVEGETNTHGCRRDRLPGGWKFLCRGNCVKEEDILVETNGNAAQRGRFSLEYSTRSLFGLEMTISNMTRSDTGWYRCGYGRALTSDSYNTFPLIVIADPSPTESPPLTTEQTSDDYWFIFQDTPLTDPSSSESPPLTTEKTSADPSSTESPPLTTEKTSADPSSTESPPLTTEKTSADPSSTESPPLTTEKTSADPSSTESPPLTTEKTSADPSSTESPPLTTEKTSADPSSTESPPLTTEKTSDGSWFIFLNTPLTGHLVPLVICVCVAGVLMLIILILYIRKKTRSNSLI
ncbi:T-cell immunoglobulin and mucin domain-containing protein 2-like isoform X1 [Cheilinus undulatus]|uniref:T-cell immunoglobulin and mucin domain-containing protein 2-like isoform X1 n=1 Tax=Cheilinus undulatus TaxID=241271 RepID=UPI001BD2CFB3|nr:T-cell immunoglobulin and mucin domain-containing protein 2-like isoform X1 [Cheilinus undulatus]